MSQTKAMTALNVRRTFDAPRERVFDAFIDADLLRNWFGPPGVTVGEVTFDARTGGRYRIEMKNSEGVDFNERGGQTDMVFTQESLPSEGSRETHAGGWNGSFDKLAALL